MTEIFSICWFTPQRAATARTVPGAQSFFQVYVGAGALGHGSTSDTFPGQEADSEVEQPRLEWEPTWDSGTA